MAGHYLPGHAHPGVGVSVPEAIKVAPPRPVATPLGGAKRKAPEAQKPEPPANDHGAITPTQILSTPSTKKAPPKRAPPPSPARSSASSAPSMYDDGTYWRSLNAYSKYTEQSFN